MTLAQLEERVTALEKVVEQLQTRENGESKLELSPSEGRREEVEEDFIPGTEHDLVVTVPPEETIYFQARIVSIEPGRPGLPLSAEEWASLGLEDEGE